MRCLLVNSYDTRGGASRAAYRLHQGLLSIDAESTFYVFSKDGNDSTVIEAKPSFNKILAKISPLINKLPLVFYPGRKRANFSPSFYYDNIPSHNSDIVHLHWIVDGFPWIEELAKFKKPIVWTLHDMWAFAGGCHYDEGCEKYIKECGNCPQLGSNKEHDLSRRIWQRKKEAWKNLDMIIVTPSRWLAECARSSSIFRDKSVKVIPYGLDTEIYKPSNKILAREKLSLPVDKKLILFGGMNASSDRRKGFQYLVPALNGLKKKLYKTTELVIFGSSEPAHKPDFGLKANYVGTMLDDLSLALLYSAADIFIAPSVQDNLPNTVMESLACGTPVVAFDVGGMPDMVEHTKNGYLAKPFDTEDLAKGIEWILEDSERNEKLSEAAREKAVREYSLETQANCYLKLYEELLENG